MPLPALVQAMLEPSFYPRRPARVELRQTHISFVFLAGDEVFKVKKPVRFNFLDFSTPERRRHFCHEEVRLNRRLAPDVYLGVVGLRRQAEGFRLTDEGDPAASEYAVHMRRLPEERTLEDMLEHDRVEPGHIDRLAALLVDFHRRAAADDAVTANGTPGAVLRVLEANYEGVAAFHGSTIAAADDEAIQRFARDFLAAHGDLLRRRQEQTRIRDGHADLRADHVYLIEPPVIVDCVEFNSEFRWCDVASDLSFLSMDLDFHGRPDLAARLVERYAALAGDRELPALVPFYACYRAYVRGKVDSLKSIEPEIEEAERRRAHDSALRHFALAYRYTWAYSPALVVVAGLSGSGKSSVAARLVERTGFAAFNSDRVRKELAGLDPTARASGTAQAELYSTAMSRRTYEELYARARQVLEAGGGVVLDATFQLREGRDRVRRMAAAAGVPHLLVECRCDDEVIRGRLRQRHRRGDDPSDADWGVFLEQKRRFEPFSPAETHLTLDTSGPLEPLIASVENELRRRSNAHRHG